MIDHQWFWDHVHSGEIWPKPRALGQKSAKDWCRHLLNVTEPEKYIVLALFVFFECILTQLQKQRKTTL